MEKRQIKKYTPVDKEKRLDSINFMPFFHKSAMKALKTKLKAINTK
jgi:hypothetical protein